MTARKSTKSTKSTKTAKPKQRNFCGVGECEWFTDGIGPTRCRKCGAIPDPDPLKPKQRKDSELSERFGSITRSLSDLLSTKLLYGAVLRDHQKKIATLEQRLDALESRDRLRDKSHDKPVSNNAEAIGWRAPRAIPKQPRWKFWRRGS